MSTSAAGAGATAGGAGLPPYAGDRPFTDADSGRFFGRAAEISQIASLTQRHRLTMLWGPSGAGMTSLAQAGLLPRARASAPPAAAFPVGRVAQGGPFPVAAIGDHNPHTLALLGTWSPGESPASLANFTITDFLRKRWRRSQSAAAHGRAPAVLCVIDQCEELLTGQVLGGRFRDAFITELAGALREIPELHVLCCVRHDYREELADLLESGGCTVEAQFEIRPLSPDAALDAVREPAAAAGRPFAAGVAEDIVAGLSGDGASAGPEVAPGLLQAVCERLWRSAPGPAREITELELRRLGGTERLLAEHCDLAVATVAEDHGLRADALWSWLQEWLVTGIGTRSLVDEEPGSTRGMPNAVLRALRNWHLISAEPRAGSRWYMLQHDCLLPPVRQERDRLRGGTGPLPARRRPAEALRAAATAMAAGETGLARRLADQALRESSSTDLKFAAQTESLIGNACYGDGDMASAEKHYRAAAALSETSRNTAQVAYLLAATGRTLLNRGQYRGAVSCLYGAVARMPNDLTVQAGLRQALDSLELVG